MSSLFSPHKELQNKGPMVCKIAASCHSSLEYIKQYFAELERGAELAWASTVILLANTSEYSSLHESACSLTITSVTKDSR